MTPGPRDQITLILTLPGTHYQLPIHQYHVVYVFQVEEDDLGATYDVDHFAGASFRDRYFRSLSRDSSPNSPRNHRKNNSKADEVCVESSTDSQTLSVEQSDNGETLVEHESSTGT